MERNRIAALTAIALMLIVPITLMLPGAEANEEPYLLADFLTPRYEPSMVAEQAGSVEAYSSTSEGTPETRNGLDDWDFSSGMGPFNSFYAAMDLSQSIIEGCSEPRISTLPDQVAFILDPDDLPKTLEADACTGEHGIMLEIPSTYWYADGDVLYLSDDPDFFGADTEVEGPQMTAYAHTVTDRAGGSATIHDFSCPGASFGIMGQSAYDAGMEDDPGISPWLILAAAIPLASAILFLIPWERRLKVDGEDDYGNPCDPGKYTRSQSEAR